MVPGAPAHPSVAAALSAAEARLSAHTDSPRADAEFLLAHLLGVSRSRLRFGASTWHSAAVQAEFEALVERRVGGEPVAYLTGTRGFWTLDIGVNPAVLIPRPETELLVEWTLSLVDAQHPHRRKSALQLADLGTGSGAIALALASELPGSFVLATDVSAAALEVARSNAQAAGLCNLRFAQGSWFDALQGPLRALGGAPGAHFHFVVSNPPYIAEGDPHLPALRHEPIGALTSGPDGLDALRQIIAGAREYLLPGGWLLVEHGYNQGEAVRGLFEAAGFGEVRTRRDLSDVERATGGRAP